MSKWTNQNAILRDLSEAQGREVPVDNVNAVADGEKPPFPNFIEETEEEYFENCVGPGDALPVPDFRLIKEMLNVVQLSNTSSDDEDEENIALSDELSPEIYITKEAVEERKHANIIKPKRMGRNVALESILQSIGKESVNENQVKKDNILKSKDCKLIDNNILQVTVNNLNPKDVRSRLNSPANSRPLALEPVNMFRKKSSTNKVVAKEKTKPSVEKNHIAETTSTYKPSELASEYYKKYVERTRIRDAMQDDIWTRAEKKMKEIEAQKELQAPQPTQSSSNAGHETNAAKIWEEINLPQHRHLLTGDCEVCKVLSLRGYHIDVTE